VHLPWPMQAKLEVGAVDDPLEREADRVAEQVMRMPDPSPAMTAPAPQRKCACGGSGGGSGQCSECAKKEELQRSAAGPAAVAEAPPIVRDVLGQPGRPLDAGTRAFFEQRMGHDLGCVRVHTDSKAAKSASDVNALAYTVGKDIVFGEGRYSPRNNEGQHLVAHELTHVLQQSSTSQRLQRQTPPPQTGPQQTNDKQQPKYLLGLDAYDRQRFRESILKGYALESTGARLTGDRERDTAILAEHFLCAAADSALFEGQPIDPDPLFCLDSEVTRGRPVFSEYKSEVIEPEYDRAPPELLQLLRIRQDLLKAIDEGLIFIGDKTASSQDNSAYLREAARTFASFKAQLTIGLPLTDAKGEPISPTPQLLSTIKTLTDAVRTRKTTGSSPAKTDFAIISLLRPWNNDTSPHKQGRAFDISIYAGKHIDMFHPEEALDGIVQLVNDLPPGKYSLGLPRQPRRDIPHGCREDFKSPLFQPYLPRLYMPGSCDLGPPILRPQILGLRNMFFPWWLPPTKGVSLAAIMDPVAKVTLQSVAASKAPQVTIGFFPDALDHVHVQLD
jgi:hypothetical protein